MEELNRIKISVVMPIYNAEKYLREALDSVVGQTLKNIEIICVNDGSTDNSLEIVKEYAQKDSRIKIIDKPNEGYGKTVNRGFSESSGEFLAIFEPDDILYPNIYSVLYKEATENNLDVVKCNFENYWSKTGNLKRSILVARYAQQDVFEPKDNLKIFTCHSSVWAGIYKRDFLNNNNIHFLETPGASFQDMSFNFKVLASVDKMKLLKEPLLKYRQDNPNSSINNPNKIYCVCDEYKELTKFLNSNPKLKKYFNAQKLVNQYRAYLWNIKRLDKSLQLEFLKEFSKEFKESLELGEITKEFFKSINKHDFNLLLKNEDLFYEKLVKGNDFYWLKPVITKLRGEH